MGFILWYVAYLWSSDHAPMSSCLSCSMCTCTHQKVLKEDPNFHPLAAPYVTHSSTFCCHCIAYKLKTELDNVT